MGHNEADGTLRVGYSLTVQAEAVVEVADELERMMAGGQADHKRARAPRANRVGRPRSVTDWETEEATTRHPQRKKQNRLDRRGTSVFGHAGYR